MVTRKRNTRIKLWVSDKEKELIQKRMSQEGFTNMSAYLRKRAIDVHLIEVNFDHLKPLTNEIREIGKEINAIIAKYNQTGILEKSEYNEIVESLQKAIELSKKYA